MKEQYERRTKTWLPRRSNTIIRLKTNSRMMDDQLDKLCLAFCNGVQGTQTCFGADREISILVIDYWCTNTDLWHNGDTQKIVSDSASLASLTLGMRFTASVFSISDQVEVYNYFVWRQKTWVTNQAQEQTRSALGHDLIQGLSLSLEKPHTGRIAMKIGKLWSMVSPPLFTQDTDFMTMLIPRYPKLDSLAD